MILMHVGLWDEEDGFYFDRIRRDGYSSPLKVRSMVGLIPFFSCFVLRESDVERWTEFSAKVRWFVDNRPDLATRVSGYVAIHLCIFFVKTISFTFCKFDRDGRW